MRRMVMIGVACVVAGGLQPRAQSLAPFTTEDMLKVATAAVLDLSEDGSRVAIAVRTLQDNAVTDHRRFGDPTYVAATLVELRVIDTRTGNADRPFKQLMNVRQAAWSRDGARLALLTTSESAERLPVTTAWIWDTARRTLTEVPRKASIAATSDLTWLPDGSRLIVALRDAADEKASQAAFQHAHRRPDCRALVTRYVPGLGQPPPR